MLEHFNADDSVESDVRGEVVLFHIARKDFQVGEASLFCRRVDVDLLCLAVGKGFDAAVWIFLGVRVQISAAMLYGVVITATNTDLSKI